MLSAITCQMTGALGYMFRFSKLHYHHVNNYFPYNNGVTKQEVTPMFLLKIMIELNHHVAMSVALLCGN